MDSQVLRKNAWPLYTEELGRLILYWTFLYAEMSSLRIRYLKMLRGVCARQDKRDFLTEATFASI